MGQPLRGESAPARARGDRQRCPAREPVVRPRQPLGFPHAVRPTDGPGARRMVRVVDNQP